MGRFGIAPSYSLLCGVVLCGMLCYGYVQRAAWHLLATADLDGYYGKCRPQAR